MRSGKRRMLGLATTVVSLVALLAAGVTPTQAATVAAAASVNVKDVLAGTSAKTFNVTVKNNEASPSSGIGGSGVGGSEGGAQINFVSIVAPAGGFSVTGGTGPSGWDAPLQLDSRELIFQGGTIAQQDAKQFQITTNVPIPAADLTKKWRVAVSSDGGQTMTVASEQAPGLGTTVRVLTSAFPGLTSPAGTTDLSVTSQQENVTGECTVTNHGSADLTVTPSLTGGQIFQDDGNAEVPAPTPTTIAPGATQTFQFPLRFGNAATSGATCDGVAKDSGGSVVAQTVAGFNETKNIVIEAARAFTYVPGSLSPLAVIPGSTGVSFQLKVNVGGVPAMDFDTAGTTIAFPGYGPASLDSPVSIGRGTQSGLTLTFAQADVPDSPDGSYDTVVNLLGTDANDAPVRIDDLPNVPNISLDDFAPFVDPDLTPPTSQIQPNDPDDPADDDAVKNGDLLRFGGTVEDRNDEGDVEGCGPDDGCSIVDADLLQFDGTNGSGTELESIDVTGNVTLANDGTLGGNYQGAYAPAALSTQLVVEVQDRAGHRHINKSNLVPVDNIKPTIKSAFARRVVDSENGSMQNRLEIVFSEPTAGTVTANDITIDGNVPTSCTRVNSRRVECTTVEEFDDDGPYGAVTYSPFLNASPVKDRVGNEMETPAAADIQDGIAPLASAFTAINGLSQADGHYWTNQLLLTVGVSGSTAKGQRALASGYSVELFEDDGDGTFGAGDSSLGTADVVGCAKDSGACALSFDTTEDLDATREGNDPADGGRALYLRATDTGGNVGSVASTSLVLDQTLPAVASVDAQDGQVVVTFSEPIRFGRDFAADWRMFDVDDERIFANSVGGSGASRTLTITDPLYDAGSLATLLYQYIGAPDQRYGDRATNTLGDFTVTL